MKQPNKKTYFISDLHLDESRPRLFTLFSTFINEVKEQAKNNTIAVYILGDLFEFWIGDDIIDKPAGRPYLSTLDQLKELSVLGVKLYFMQGNRDFLAQTKFTNYIGAILLPDQHIIDLYGTPTLLMHGDTLCTDDVSYQRMRRFFRNRLIQILYLALSPKRRLRIAGRTRSVIKTKTPKKPKIIMDVNQKALEKTMLKAGVQQLIHGHTHRPDVHEFELAGKPAKRIVLSDWQNESQYLCFDGL